MYEYRKSVRFARLPDELARRWPFTSVTDIGSGMGASYFVVRDRSADEEKETQANDDPMMLYTNCFFH